VSDLPAPAGAGTGGLTARVRRPPVERLRAQRIEPVATLADMTPFRSLPTVGDVPAPQLHAWRAFLEAHARTTERLERELREEQGIPLAWYDVLVHLHEADGHRLRMQELAGEVLLSKSGLTRLIDRMERAGLVRRAACAEDRRGTFAELTDGGRQTLRRTAPTHLRGVGEHFAAHLSDDEADILQRALYRIADAARADH
jgi:DNA-binding MarR family transcriptional regulator